MRYQLGTRYFTTAAWECRSDHGPAAVTLTLRRRNPPPWWLRLAPRLSFLHDAPEVEQMTFRWRLTQFGPRLVDWPEPDRLDGHRRITRAHARALFDADAAHFAAGSAMPSPLFRGG